MHFSDPAFWRAGAISTIVVMSVFLNLDRRSKSWLTSSTQSRSVRPIAVRTSWKISPTVSSSVLSRLQSWRALM